MRGGWRKFIIALLLLGMTASCANKKHLTRSDKPEDWQPYGSGQGFPTLADYLTSVEAAGFSYDHLQARGKAFFSFNKQNAQEASFQLRMKKDEVIWISATSLLGTEVGRLMIRPDSLFLVNRMESTFQKVAFEQVQEWMGYSLDFSALQQLLVGNFDSKLFPASGTEDNSAPINLNNESHAFRNESGAIKLEPVTGLLSIITNEKRMSAWQVQNRFYEMLSVQHAFEDAVTFGGFPSKSSISFQTSKIKLIGSLEYNRLERPAALQFPFSIPKGYRQVH